MAIVLLCAGAWLAATTLVVALCAAARLGDDARPTIGPAPASRLTADADPGFVLTFASQVRGVPRSVAPRAHTRR